MSQLVDARADRPAAVTAAADALRASDLVVLPTDTVYGIAADAFNRDATPKIFAAKRRPRTFPLPVFVRSPKQLTGLVTTVPEEAERLMAAYWPGPLTLVVRCDPNLVWDLGENAGTVAVRMPFDEVTLDIIRAIGPLAVTSANLSGQQAATSAHGAREQLSDDVAVYVDDGPRRDRLPSTIVDLTRPKPHVLRHGIIGKDEIMRVAAGTLGPTDVTGVPAPEPAAPPPARVTAEDRARLAAIPGLGPAKAEALLTAFGSVAAVAAASRDDLMAVRGIGDKMATTIQDALGD